MKIKSIRQIGKSNANNTSYVLSDCQKHLNSSIERTNKNWIELTKIFQNLEGKQIATISGVLKNNKDVVVKIQPIKLSRNEFEFGEILKTYRGFIEFYCIVTCGTPPTQIIDYGKAGTIPAKKLCDKKGDNIGIIVMPYYKNGSFKEFLDNCKGDKHTIHITVLAILSYYMVYKKLGFVHGDFYTKNIVVDENYRPLIIDFEHSSFNSQFKLSLFWRDIENFLSCIYPFVNKDLNSIIRTHVVMNNAHSIEPNDKIIKALIDAILTL